MNPPCSSWRGLAALALAAGLITACGGVDSGGTGMTAQTNSAGRISGFGSVIVNGVRFDDTLANIVDDDDVAHVRGDLKLGMVVEIEAGAIQGRGTSTASSVASKIQFANEIAGPVELVDASAGTLTVLGQAVKVDVATVFDGYANRLASAKPGDQVVVFAFYDATAAVYKAARIELRASLAAYKLRGAISQLGGTTFAIGGAIIDYSGVAPASLPQLSNGMVVRVSLSTTQNNGVWVATKVRTSARKLPEGHEAEQEGFVAEFVSLASFKVNGVPVNASAAGVAFPHGSQLANGVRVEVEGVVSNGVLLARKVDVKNADGGDEQFELHGAIESVVDTVAQTFVLRGVTVSYAASSFESGHTAAELKQGVTLEAKGVLSADGTELQATSIEFN